jgi:hypothetical protein
MKTETVTVKLLPGMVVSFDCEDPNRLENFMGRTLHEQNEFEATINHYASPEICIGAGPYKHKWRWMLVRMLEKAADNKWSFERVPEE